MNADLRCVECSLEQAAGEFGWKAFLTTDEDEPAEAIVYCPECAESDFEFDLNLLDAGN